jgi:hypothetical protein
MRQIDAPLSEACHGESDFSLSGIPLFPPCTRGLGKSMAMLLSIMGMSFHRTYTINLYLHQD